MPLFCGDFMRVSEINLTEEDEVILKLDDLYSRCEQLLIKFENDSRIKQEMVGKEVIKLIAQQTDLIICYTMILPEVVAMGDLIDAFIKKVAATIQKNLNASSHKALGEREMMRLIEGDSKMLQWLQHRAQINQFELHFKTIQQLLVSRGFALRSICEAHIHDKSEVII